MAAEYVDINAGQGGVGFVIDAVWAFVAVHADGDEGVLAMSINGQWVPFIAADRTRLEELIPKARALGKASNKSIRLVRFDARTVVEVFHPDGRRSRPG